MRPLLARLTAGLMALLPLAAIAEPIGYAAGGDNQLYRLDLGTGQATRVGAMGFVDVEGLALSPDGVLYGVADAGTGLPGSAVTDLLIRIDPATGAASAVGPLGLMGQGTGSFFDLDYGLAFTCDGRLWMSSDTTSRLWQVDRFTGATQYIGDLGARISGLAGRGRELLGVSVAGGENLYRIDPENAQATFLGTLAMPNPLYDAGLDFDATGRLWATLDYLAPPQGIPPLRNDIARLDPATGQRLETRTVTGAGTDINTVQMEGLAIAPVAACGNGNGGNNGGGNGSVSPLPVPGPSLPWLTLFAAVAVLAASWRIRSR
jgi:hypothetical protein